jgi:DNA-binding transcriptional LysR family regulator
MIATLTDPGIRHNVELTEPAFGHAEGWSDTGPDLMRFDLVDLQLFIAVADSRSITRGADRAHLALASVSARIKGLEDALGVMLFNRGRRGVELTAAGENLLDHARLVIQNVETMRGDLARYAKGMRASVLLLANTSGLSEHLPRALASFLREQPDINVDVEERESTDIASAIATGAADLGFAAEHALPDHVERFTFSEDRLTLVTARRGPLAGRRLIDFKDAAASNFVGLTNATALQAHISRHAARLGVRLHVRARLRDFDAICQMVAADVGVAVVPEAAAKRCARTMGIVMVKLRDPWANRRLVICARSFKALPRPAKLLVEHLRASAEHSRPR